MKTTPPLLLILNNYVSATIMGILIWFLFSINVKADLKISPAVIPTTNIELLNPGRGFYRWNNAESASVASIDNYLRLNWSAVEKTQGSYDFSSLDTQANLAKFDTDGKGSLGFGIRCVVETNDHAYPAYLDSKMSSWYSTLKKCWVPDWNNAYFLERHDSLVAALGRKYNADPRIGYVEIRSFGNWGEWHLSGFEAPVSPLVTITPATIFHLIDSYVKAFPNKQLIMLSDSIGLRYALSITGLNFPIGWRRDSWCNKQFGNFKYNPTTRWKTAPVIVEAYGNNKNDCSLALQQIIDHHVSAVGNGNLDWAILSTAGKDSLVLAAKTAGYRDILRSVTYPSSIIPGQAICVNTQWSNVGVAPVYKNWIITYRLCNTVTGMPVWESVSKFDLRTLLPTYNFSTQVDMPVLVYDTLSMPLNLPVGNYAFELFIADPTNYSSPLRLANEGRKANGAYDLGTISITLVNAVTDLKSMDDFTVLSVLNSQIKVDVQQAGKYSMAIYSLDGRCIYAQQHINLVIGVQQINIIELANGVYALKISKKNKQKTMRFILN